MKKLSLILVGGAGTLASDLLPILKNDFDLNVIDDFSSSVLHEKEVEKYAKVERIDASDETLLKLVFERVQPDSVIFLATSMSKVEKIAFGSNIKAMNNVIQSAETTSLPLIVYIQSFLTRKTDDPISEITEIEAKDSYSVWKLGAELLLNDYKGMHSTVILSSVVSPRLNVGAIPAFASRILKNELIKVTKTYRDYLNPIDFTNFINKLLAQTTPPKKIVVGSGSPLATVEILKKVCVALDRDLSSIRFEEIEPKNSDPKMITLDSSLAKKEFEVDFGTNFDEAIKKTVENYLINTPQVRLHH
jgi:nucleoside-diphosphate-sugar epimerase